MPVWKSTETPRKVSQYDVCAQYGSSEDFLIHALLCASPAEWSNQNRKLLSVHMGPPLRRNPRKVDVVGSVFLNSKERQKVDTFVKEQLNERRAYEERLESLGESVDPRAHYIICPASLPPSGNNAAWRYSCVGFVLEAYAEADIELVHSDVPLADMKQIALTYPIATTISQAERDTMGIGEGNAWPIVFVGYVMASLERPPDEIRQTPYSPNIDDIYFSPATDD